jgi:hypothetical protein
MKALIGLLIAATLVVGSGCAKQDWIDRTLVTVDVTGVWDGIVMVTPGAPSFPQARIELQQQGPNVTGHWSAATPMSGPIEGTVAGDVLRFSSKRGISAELTVSGDEMTGTLSDVFGTRPLSLRRVSPSSQPVSPPR